MPAQTNKRTTEQLGARLQAIQEVPTGQRLLHDVLPVRETQYEEFKPSTYVRHRQKLIVFDDQDDAAAAAGTPTFSVAEMQERLRPLLEEMRRRLDGGPKVHDSRPINTLRSLPVPMKGRHTNQRPCHLQLYF